MFHIVRAVFGYDPLESGDLLDPAESTEFLTLQLNDHIVLLRATDEAGLTEPDIDLASSDWWLGANYDHPERFGWFPKAFVETVSRDTAEVMSFTFTGDQSLAREWPTCGAFIQPSDRDSIELMLMRTTSNEDLDPGADRLEGGTLLTDDSSPDLLPELLLLPGLESDDDATTDDGGEEAEPEPEPEPQHTPGGPVPRPITTAAGPESASVAIPPRPTASVVLTGSSSHLAGGGLFGPLAGPPAAAPAVALAASPMDLTRLDQGFYRMAHALMAHAPQASSGMHRMLPFSRDEVIRVMDAPADLPGGAPAGYLFGQNTAGQSGFFPPHLVQFFQTSDYLADQIALAQLDRFIDLKRPRPVRIGDEVLPAPPPGWRYSRNPAGRPYLYCTETGARAWSVFEIARGQGLLDAGGPALSPSTPGGHGGSLRVAVGQEPRTPGSAYASSSLTTGSDQRKNVAFLRSLRRRDHQSHDRYVPLGSPELSISFGEGGLFGGERGLADNDPTLRTMVRAPLEGATAVALANGSATGPGQPGMRMGGSPSRAAIGLTQVALAGGAGIGAGDAAADGQSSGSRQLIALTKLSMYLPSSPLEGAPGAGDLTATASPGPASALPPPLTGMSHPPAGAQPHPHPHPESHPHQPSDGMRQQQQQQQQSRSPPPPSMPLPHPVPHPPPASAQGHGMAPSHAAQLHHHHLHHLHHLHHHHHHHQQQQQQQHMYSTYPAPQHHPGMADPVQPSLPVRPDTLPGMVPGTSARSLPPPIMVPMVPAGAAGGFSAPTSISSLPPLESPSSVYMTPLIIRSPPGSGTALERAASNPSLLGGALGHGPAGGMGMMVDPARGPRAVGLPPPLVADVAAGVVGGRGPGSVGSVGDLDGSDLDMSLPPPLVLAEDATEEPLLPLAPPPKPERPSAPGTPGPRGTVHIMAGAASLPLPLPLAPALAPPALLEPAGAPAAPVAGPPPPECDLAETASCSSSPSSSPLPPPLLEVSPLPGVGEEGDPEQGGRAALSHRHSAPPSPSPGGVSGGPDSGVLVDVGSTVSARADPAGGAAAGSAAVPPPTADEAPAVEPLAPAAASRPDVENNEHYARLSQQARQITVALRRLDGAVRANRGSDSDPAAGDERPVRLSPRSHAELRLVLDAGRALVSESAARILVQATSLSAVVAKQAARAAAAGAEVPDARALFRAAVSSLERSMAELDRLLAPLCQAEEEIFGEEPESLASGTAADQPAITRNQAATAIATVVSATASVQGAAHALLLSI